MNKNTLPVALGLIILLSLMFSMGNVSASTWKNHYFYNTTTDNGNGNIGTINVGRWNGMSFRIMSSNITLSRVIKLNTDNSTQARLENASHFVLNETNFIGNIATFITPQALTANTSYYILTNLTNVTVGGIIKNSGGKSSNTYLNFTGGWDVNDNSAIYSIYGLAINAEGETSQTYNTSTYETISETYSIELSYDNLSYSNINAYLKYNGTDYLGTKIGSGNNILFSKTLGMESPYGNKSFYWTIGLTNSSGITNYTSNSYNQTVNPITLSLCNATYTIPYINFTFKDETTDSLINASMDLATWTYTLGTTTKSLIVSNTSTNPNYAFCFSPSDKTISQTVTFQYANTGYYQRQYYRSGTLTNSTTNQVLYLLGSGSGIYSTFVTSSSANAPISGVTLQFERQFNGIWTLISQATSDSAGSATVWVNPNYDLRVTATKTGYASTTVTLRPSQSVYTIIMGGGTNNQSYSSILEGITYSFYPPSNFLNKGTDYLFGLNINSSLCNLAKYKLELTLSNLTIINYVEGTNPCGSNISLTQNTNDYNLIYARYYVDTGTGYYDISPSAYPIENVTAGDGSIWKAMNNLINYRSGSMADNYGQLWWLFFLTFVLLAILCYSTGAELSNPGIVLPIVLLWILMFSIMGFFTMNFTGSPGHPQNTWVNQYAIFFVALCFTLGYIFRRLSE